MNDWTLLILLIWPYGHTWCPRQIPKIGFGFGKAKSFFTSHTVAAHVWMKMLVMMIDDLIIIMTNILNRKIFIIMDTNIDNNIHDGDGDGDGDGDHLRITRPIAQEESIMLFCFQFTVPWHHLVISD